MRQLAKEFLKHVKYTDCMDDFFMLSEKKSILRLDLANTVRDIRNEKNIETAFALARNYWYNNYCMIWNGIPPGNKYLLPTYTIEFEKILRSWG